MESGEKNIVTASSLAMRMEVYSSSPGTLRGQLHSQHLEKPYNFYSFIRAIDKMDEIFNAKGFPGTFLSPRSFEDVKRGKAKKKTDRGAPATIQPHPVEEDEADLKCTFDITVRFRQNATWQGQILWVEKGLKQDFRSVLEMLRLIDEAMMDDVEDPNQIEWEGPKPRYR